MKKVRTTTSNRISELISNLASDDSRLVDRSEISLVRHFGDLPVEQLLEACESPNPKVRMRAVFILGKKNDKRALETFLRLTEDEDESVSYDAVLALGRLGDNRAILPLVDLLCVNGEESSVRYAAAEALATLGSDSVLPLLEHLGKTHDSSIQAIIADIFSKIRDPRTIESLSNLLTTPDERVHIAAEEALNSVESK